MKIPRWEIIVLIFIVGTVLLSAIDNTMVSAHNISAICTAYGCV